MEHLYSVICKYLNCRREDNRPFLLAFSGGPDSLALFHLLLRYRKEHGTTFAIAHIDHGWRFESKREAEEIVALAADHEVVSHLLTLSPEMMTGNLEAACRDARYKFFEFLCREHGYKALMLGHHADDQAETVLKRLFEGASLGQLGGIKPAGEYRGIPLWRPFLSVKKKEILQWLSHHELKGIYDRTNDDVRFMRARMRHELIPLLSERFGKEISPALCRLGEEAQELEEYLDVKIAQVKGEIVCGDMGLYLESAELSHMATLEIKHLIRRIAAISGLSLSREALDNAAALLQSQAIDKRIPSGSGDLAKVMYIDSGRLFVPVRELSAISYDPIELLTGSRLMLGSWEITVEEVKNEFPRGTLGGWRQLWCNGTDVILPKKNYVVCPPHLNSRMADGEMLGKRLSREKVPTLLRSIVPVIMNENGIVHEFLTGSKQENVYSEDSSFVKVHIQWKVKLAVDGE